MAHIRPYRPSDEAAIIHIFRETAANDLRQAGDPALHISSFIWARPYLHLSPTYCFVIDDGLDTAVGYVIACPDTKTFVTSYRHTYLSYLESCGITNPDLSSLDRYQEDLKERKNANHRGLTMDSVMQILAYTPEQMLVPTNPSLVIDYPAHLHIDILPSHQRQGYGRKLVETLCEKLQQEGVKGIHLGMVGTNEGAKTFYHGLGFQRFNEIMDNGISGELGMTGDGGLWLVKKLS